MVILDTNIIIDHLRRKNGESLLINLSKTISKEEMAISVVTVQELYEGKSTLNLQDERILLAIITPLNILPYNYEVAHLAGVIARDIKRPIEFVDASIAATSILNDAELVTLNKKDFLGIKNLRLFKKF